MASTSPSRNQPRPSRRRQRSVRVTVAVALLSLATLAVILALPTGSVVWMGVASVLSLVCGWASARIIYNELARFGFLLLLVVMSSTSLGRWMSTWRMQATSAIYSLFSW